MYKIGDLIVYKRDVCRVLEYKEKYFKDKDYYSLNPIYDNSLKIDVPIDSTLLRNVMSKEKAEDIINSIPSIDIIDVNDKMMENEYKRLINEGGYEGLVSVIKTTYLRNNDRLNSKRKISEKDENYFNTAEKILYGELAVALDMSIEDIKDYVIKRVNEIEEKM